MQIARAIYRKHWRAPAPAWDSACADTCNWVRAQAVAAIMAVSAERLAIRDRQRQRGRTRAADRAATERAVAPPVEHPIEQPAEPATRPPGSVPLSRPR